MVVKARSVARYLKLGHVDLEYYLDGLTAKKDQAP